MDKTDIDIMIEKLARILLTNKTEILKILKASNYNVPATYQIIKNIEFVKHYGGRNVSN